MLKSGTIGARLPKVDTKVIYESDDHVIMAQKIVHAFDVGDLVKIYGVSSVHFGPEEKIIPLPEGVCCEIIGKKAGFVICYPKGFMAVRYLMMLDLQKKEFKWRTGVNENQKHFYEIWRSK